VLIPADRGCEIGGYVYAFDKESGKLRWKLRASAPSTNLVVAGDAVIFGTRTDEWLSVAIDSGRVNWQFKDAAPDPECQFPKIPATDGLHVSLVSHKGVLYTLDAKSGHELRKAALPSPATAGLFMYKDVLYFGTEDGRLHGIIPEDGRELAQQRLPGALSGRFVWTKRPPETYFEYAFATTAGGEGRHGMVLAFNDEFERTLWSQTGEREWTSEQPHVWKQWLVAGNCRGDVVAYSLADGKVAWEEHVKGCVRSFGDDGSTLYIGVQEGTVYAYRR
jgi:outer membrane protein assembly factor BamB